ncbi:MAG: ferrochelatase [Ramlibacter sp.]|nr:ferrochelatase [Ramlibacter sp.]
MAYRPEPASPSPSSAPVLRTAVVLCNLGTPDAPTTTAVRRYLAEFLSDPRVVEIPAAVWKPILHGIVLRTRPAQSAAKYRTVWTEQGSPLLVWTVRQAELLQQWLQARGQSVRVLPAMRYGQPALTGVLDQLKAEGVERILVLPAYPQYSGSTTGSVLDCIYGWSRQIRNIPEMRFVNRYPDDAGYIAALADSVRAHWQQHGQAEKLVLSYHGVPKRTVAQGDPYLIECHQTTEALRLALGLAPEQILMTFQSRFGKAEWLQPYTEPTLIALAQQGLRQVDMMCPGFTADCLETLEEIDAEVREAFLHAGGQDYRYIPCLNDRPLWIDALGDLCQRHLAGWPTHA